MNLLGCFSQKRSESLATQACHCHHCFAQFQRRPSCGSDLGGGVLPYMGYIGMCDLKGYGFSAVLVINRVSILAILVINRIWVLHSCLELGTFF